MQSDMPRDRFVTMQWVFPKLVVSVFHIGCGWLWQSATVATKTIITRFLVQDSLYSHPVTASNLQPPHANCLGTCFPRFQRLPQGLSCNWGRTQWRFCWSFWSELDSIKCFQSLIQMTEKYWQTVSFFFFFLKKQGGRERCLFVWFIDSFVRDKVCKRQASVGRIRKEEGRKR